MSTQLDVPEARPFRLSWRRRVARIAIVVSFGVAVACRSGNNLIEELRTRESREGLALIRPHSNWFAIVSFEKGGYIVRNPRGLASAWIATGGNLVAWNTPAEPVLKPCDGVTTIETMTGKLVRQIPGQLLYVRTMAISPDGLRVAFDGSYIPSVTTGSSGSRENGTGMHYLDVETGRLSSVPIESTHAEDEMSWSPSGEAFTYANGNRIYILDVSTGAPKLIGHGQNPTWSPDGQWITFRSMDDWAMAVNPVTLESKKLLPDNKILGAVHWSPDSQYVLVSEAVGALSNILHWRSPIWGPVAELVS